MFSISLGEIFLVGLVAVLVLKPEDFKVIYSQFKKLTYIINKETQDIKDVIKKIDQDEKLSITKMNIEKNNLL